MVSLLATNGGLIDREGFAAGVKAPLDGFDGSGTDIFKSGEKAIPIDAIITERVGELVPIFDPLEQTTDQPEEASDLSQTGDLTKKFTEEKEGMTGEQVKAFLTRLWEGFRALDTGTQILLVGIAILLLRSR